MTTIAISDNIYDTKYIEKAIKRDMLRRELQHKYYLRNKEAICSRRANIPIDIKREQNKKHYDKVKDDPEHKAKRKETNAISYQKRKAKQAEIKLPEGAEQNQNQSQDDSSK